MRKLLLPILLLLTLAVIVSAVPMPAPVVGTLSFNGVVANSIGVTVTNLQTGEVLTYAEVASLKTENGKFAFDLGNFKQGYTVKDRRGSGDVIEVRVCDSVPECVYTYEVLDTSVRTLEFRIGSAPPPPVQEPEVVVVPEPETRYVCQDGSVASTLTNCPAVVPPEPVAPEKDSGNLVAGLLASLLYIAADIFAQFKWGKGFAAMIRAKLKAGKTETALKMTKTVIRKFKEGKYSKK